MHRLFNRFALVVALVLTFGTAGAAGVLDANTASADEIAAVPGIDESLAARIVESRPFGTASEFDALLDDELDADAREAVYAHLFVPIELNSASEEDILLIPGVGRRMAHEFEEYRPYSNLEQFRREIGKYVDAEEVARLEQYVTLD